jgi:hypothetical protein
MKSRIFIQQWLELKPYNNQTLTDNYYLNLSNKLKKVLYAPDAFVLLMYIDKEDIDLLSCFLASYFEDIISETNIWNSFTAIHQTHYNKRLPFYNMDEYFEGEINTQDIAFLIWYFLNTIQREKFISPFNDFITNLALKVMVILDEEYEYAPENKVLKKYYSLPETESDFYKVRSFIDNILFKTWLFFPDTALLLAERENELIEENDDENLMHYLQETRDSLLHSNHTRLLSLKGKEWAANILGENHTLAIDLQNMSQRIRGFFLYKGQDQTDIDIEHIASGKKFKLTKKSFDHAHLLDSIDIIMYIGIVNWQNEWWFSGVYFQNEFNADLVLNEKNSMESRMQVNFLDHSKEGTKELLKQQLNAFIDFNHGEQIAFMPMNEIEGFVKDYMEYFTTTLHLSEKEIMEAKQRARSDGYFGDKENDKFIDTEIAESGLVFFNPESGVEIAFNFNETLPFKNNPFFNADEDENEILDLFISEETSTELVKYCIKHCKSKIPFLKKETGKKYLEDIDFLLRFWKGNNYFTKPSVTYTGQKG